MRFLPGGFGLSIMLLWGSTLSDERPFITANNDTRYPAITAEGSNVYLTWLSREKRPSHVFFCKSSDDGNNWTAPQKISNPGGDCMPPTITAASGTLHLAWVDCGEVIEGELYYTQSTDGGMTWKKSAVIVDTMKSATNPMMTAHGDHVYLIWQNVATTVYFKASYDKGLTWEKEVLLGDVGKHSCYCYPPALAVHGDTLTVVWNDLSGAENQKSWFPFFGKADTSTWISSIICRTSNDNGRTWNRERTLASKPVLKETVDEVDNPVLFSDSVRTWLFWQDKHTVPLGEILFTRITATAKKRITGTSLFPAPKRAVKCPSGVFDGSGNLHLTWTSKSRGVATVHYGILDSSGKALRVKVNLTSTESRYQNPVMARTASGTLYIAWFNKSDDKKVPSTMFLTASSNSGLTWESHVSQQEEP